MLFIKRITRWISVLEGEMYQLNHKLTEQKNMMTAIIENTIASDKSEIASLCSYFCSNSIINTLG